MEAIVLAGGLGTRLRESVPALPKPMASIAGRPFLEILLNSLAHKGFRRVVLSLGYMAETVIAHFGDKFGEITLLYEIERTPLGTGGAVRQALTQCHNDHAFVFNGDTYLDLEVESVDAHWRTHRAPIIVATQLPNTARYGSLETSDGRVVGFHEKGGPEQGLINAGCYVLNADLLNQFALGQPFSLETDFLPAAVRRARFDLFVSKGYFIDIGVPEDYARAQVELAGMKVD